jgi:hypothetical protein
MTCQVFEGATISFKTARAQIIIKSSVERRASFLGAAVVFTRIEVGAVLCARNCRT